MKILVINCGSSTLKFEFFALETRGASVNEQRLAGGIVDKIGGRADIKFRAKSELFETKTVSDHGQASRLVLDWLASSQFFKNGLDAVGHRIIHGGDKFSQPILIDEKVINAILDSSELAPLHNQPSLSAIQAVQERLGTKIPMIAVFDTAFHHTLPEPARRYAIPLALADKHHIRRYGFHGLAHRYMMERYATITNTPLKQTKLITLQLGNGCSATAIAGGRSVDTSMGFTPLEGLMMGSRSGDVDPTLASFLAQREGVDVATAEDWLNTKSGLLGVSGRSRDMRRLLDAEGKGDKMAGLATDMFCYRLKKYIGAYLATLDGADAIIFGGGIGENAPEVRQRVLAGMDWLGLKLDKARNKATVGSEGRISTDDARIHAYVIPVDEAIIIARDTFSLLKRLPRMDKEGQNDQR